MAINPMQRKSRNSFLLGMFVMLLVAAVIVGLLLMQIMNLKKAELARKNNKVMMYVLNKDVKSGDEIKTSDLEQKIITIENIETGDTRTTATEIKIDPNEVAQALDLIPVKNAKIVSKIDLPKGTALMKNMIVSSEQAITNGTRLQEYNMISLPSDLQVGEYIDVRITLPTGQDYIVVSKKIVDKTTERLLRVSLTEDEILTMSSAIVEAYYMNGSKLYATRYVEPGTQEAATPTYPVANNIAILIGKDPNVVTVAKEGLNARLNDGGNTERERIFNNMPGEYTNGGSERVNSKVVEEINKALEDRTNYLKNLNAAVE